MRRRVSVLETLRRYMRVDLRGGKVRVAQKFLDASEIRAAIQHMRRERMPKAVRRNFFLDPGDLRVSFYNFPKRLARHLFPKPCEK